MSRHNNNRYQHNWNSTPVQRTGDKLFKVTTSPTKADGTFSATFTGLLNYTGGGTVSGVWDFGDGQVMDYNGDNAFTHHGYDANSQYRVKLSITKSYCKTANQWNAKTDQYLMEKTIEIGAKGVQRNATFKQTSQVS